MDVPFRDARALARSALNVDDNEPIVAAGHQPEFIHPGVWAKHAVLQRLARVVGAMPLNLVVDQDTPKHARIDIPSIVDGRPIGDNKQLWFDQYEQCFRASTAGDTGTGCGVCPNEVEECVGREL